MNELDFLLELENDGPGEDVRQATHLCERGIGVCGDGTAMCKLLQLLENGADGVEKEVVWATEHGNLLAKVQLAVSLEDGTDGVGNDTAGAKELYESVVGTRTSVTVMARLAILCTNHLCIASGMRMET